MAVVQLPELLTQIYLIVCRKFINWMLLISQTVLSLFYDSKISWHWQHQSSTTTPHICTRISSHLYQCTPCERSYV